MIKKPYVVLVIRGVSLELEFTKLEDALARAQSEYDFDHPPHVSVWRFQTGDGEPVKIASLGEY